MKVSHISFPNTSSFRGVTKGRTGLGMLNGALVTCDSTGNTVELVPEASLVALRMPFDGAPVAYVAEVAATFSAYTYTGAGAAGSLALATIAPYGGADDYTLDLVDPASPSATLTVTDSPGTKTVTVSLATGVGAAAAHILNSGVGGVGHRLTTTLSAAGVAGNSATLAVTLPTYTNLFGASFTRPSQVLAYALGGSNYIVKLATGAGTAGVLTLTESSGSLGEITITQAAAYAGAWGNTKVAATIGFTGMSTPLAVVASITAGVLNIAIGLETDSEGLPVAISDDLLAAAIEAALVIVDGTTDLSTHFVVASATAGSFDTGLAQVTMSGGVDAVGNDAANTATLVGAVIAGATGIATVGIDAGTDVVAVSAASNFTGGGASAAITTDLTALKAALLASSSIIRGGALSNGTTLCTDVTLTLTGGADLVAATIGTPAAFMRQATDGTDVWTAMVEDLTGTTLNTWVKTFTA